MKFLKEKKHTIGERGFTLLFAVLIASVLLSLALAIFNQLYQSLLLSSSNKESLAAFYAADFGMECAYYWDLKHIGFPTSIFPASSASTDYSGSESISCNGQKFNKSWLVTRYPSSATTIFNLSFTGGSFPTEGCSKITVSKNLFKGKTKTTIESRGYNTCDTSSPKRVERLITVTY